MLTISSNEDGGLAHTFSKGRLLRLKRDDWSDCISLQCGEGEGEDDNDEEDDDNDNDEEEEDDDDLYFTNMVIAITISIEIAITIMPQFHTHIPWGQKCP